MRESIQDDGNSGFAYTPMVVANSGTDCALEMLGRQFAVALPA